MSKSKEQAEKVKTSGIIIDIGTGDGKFVYELAKQYPDRLIIGIDPNHKNLIDYSSKIYRKSQKGGVNNAVYVLANVTDLPDELENTANQIFINFPWGSLLKNIVEVDADSWNNIKKISQDGTIIDVLFGYDPTTDKGESNRLLIPELSKSYIIHEMAPKLKDLGFIYKSLKQYPALDLVSFPTSWAKKLIQRQNRIYFHLQLIVKKS